MSELKDKYEKYWAISSIREEIAKKWLRLVLNLKEKDITVNGIGVLSTDRVDETWEGDPFKKFDFYIPRFKLYLDVTGTSLTKGQSKSRAHKMNMQGSVIAVLGVKVSVAEILESKGYKAVFMNIADSEGEVRFMPFTLLRTLEKHGKAVVSEEFAKGERTYVLTRWKDWMKPSQFKRWLSVYVK
ncbi:nuclease [Sulfolobus sp. E11-6]|uniref:nuclease n=1 Tax=Sulfolobus sp. E11-6 TaxID=2663020 RepID=UPI001EEA430E|nr:nuclease [Sulfolobus sp. E11-6]